MKNNGILWASVYLFFCDILSPISAIADLIYDKSSELPALNNQLENLYDDMNESMYIPVLIISATIFFIMASFIYLRGIENKRANKSEFPILMWLILILSAIFPFFKLVSYFTGQPFSSYDFIFGGNIRAFLNNSGHALFLWAVGAIILLFIAISFKHLSKISKTENIESSDIDDEVK